jgi:hypothetical protein
MLVATVLSSQDSNGSVTGAVIDAQTQAPVSGVHVEISGIGQTTTGDDGRFRISNVPPGRHILQAVRTGMVAVSENRSSGTVTVAAGEEVPNVRLRMASFGTVRGHIRDDQGNPLSGVSIQALVLSYQQGRRVLVAPSLTVGILDSSTETDEKGAYQLELPPGIYYVCGQFRSSRGNNEGTARVFGGTQKVCYPGTPDVAYATPVTLSSGEVPGIDIHLAQASQTTHKIYVRVEGVAPALRNFNPAGAQIAELRDRFSLDRLPILGSLSRGSDSASQGMVIDDVPNGSYDLLMDGVMEGGVRGRGITPIDVRDEDLHDVVVALQPAQDISGAVVGTDPLRPRSFSGLSVLLGSRSTVVAPDGTFAVTGVLSGFYSVTVQGLPPDAYISDIRYGGSSLHETAHSLNGPELQGGAGSTPLQILVAYNGGAIEGMAEEREAAAGATVVLVPSLSRRFVQSDYRVTTVGSDGSFSLKGVPPGVYQLFVWESVPDTAWLNPEFMSRWDGRGQVLSITAGGSVTVRARLFSRDN